MDRLAGKARLGIEGGGEKYMIDYLSFQKRFLSLCILACLLWVTGM